MYSDRSRCDHTSMCSLSMSRWSTNNKCPDRWYSITCMKSSRGRLPLATADSFQAAPANFQAVNRQSFYRETLFWGTGPMMRRSRSGAGHARPQSARSWVETHPPHPRRLARRYVLWSPTVKSGDRNGPGAQPCCFCKQLFSYGGSLACTLA